MLKREEVLKDIPNRIGSDIKIQFRLILLSTELEAGNILDLCQIGFYVVRCVFNTERQEASQYDLTLKVWSKFCQIVKGNIQSNLN